MLHVVCYRRHIPDAPAEPQPVNRTFYVDSVGGSDSNTFSQAQSEATPWKSLEPLLTERNNFQANDRILFKRNGDSYPYRRTHATLRLLTAPDCGTTGNRVRYAAYGEGDMPLIDARVLARQHTRWEDLKFCWTTDNDGHPSFGSSDRPLVDVYCDGCRFLCGAPDNSIYGEAVSLYYGAQNTTFHECIFESPFTTTGYLHNAMTGCSYGYYDVTYGYHTLEYVTIEYCEFPIAGRSGLEFLSRSDGTNDYDYPSHHVYLRHNVFRQIGGLAISFGGISDTGTYPGIAVGEDHHLYIEGNRIVSAGLNEGAYPDIGGHGIEVQGWKQAHVADNVVRNCNTMTLCFGAGEPGDRLYTALGAYDSDGLIENNIFDGRKAGTVALECSGWTFRQNKVYAHELPLYIRAADYCTFEANDVEETVVGGGALSTTQSAVRFYGADHIDMLGNTLRSRCSSGVVVSQVHDGHYATNINFNGNTFYKASGATAIALASGNDSWSDTDSTEYAV